MRMNHKKIYIILVTALLALVLLIAKRTEPELVRSQQHLTYNTEIEDTNLSIDADRFSSKLPVVSIQTGGQTIPGKPGRGQHVSEIENSFIQADVEIFDREGQLHALSDAPDLKSDIQIRIRGNSSRYFEKTGFMMKFIDSSGNKSSHKVMGMEKNNSWVLNGPFLDKTLMRNYMWYNLSGQLMEWAPDVRFCELFIDQVYQGLYLMVEQIDVGEGRINISKYDGKSPVSSYILHMDRDSVNNYENLDNFTEYTYRLASQGEVKYPGENLINEAVLDYINKDFSMFEKALYSYDYDTKLYGYKNYIDVSNFVDYFIINEVTKNLDAGTYSTYFYKDVAGKLKMAVWDFNNCCDNYEESRSTTDGFFLPSKTWFFMLCKDEAFVEQVIQRYRQLRQGILSDEDISAYIENVSSYLGSAVDRNFQVWGFSFLPENDRLPQADRRLDSYGAALDQYHSWLLKRLEWLDGNIDVLRSYSHESVNKKYNH